VSKKVVRKKRAGKKPAKKTAKKKAAAKKSGRKKVVAKTSARRKSASKSAGKKVARKKTTGKKTTRKKAARKKASRPKKVSYMAAPFRSVTPHIVVGDAAAAIDFYQRAFGAVERFRLPAADGKHVMHAEIMIGDTVVMMAEETPDYPSKSPLSLGGSPVSLHLYVPNTDAVYSRALAAGATGTMPPQDMFWGDRFSQVTDPFGHKWSIATHMRDPSPAEMAAGAAAMGQQG
jgi:uncharacterized glyoxalase superfamily protein PhnB